CAKPCGQRQRGALEGRELCALPSEIFQQLRKEQTAGVVAGAENEHQRNEEARDDDPTLSFPLRHQRFPDRRLIATRRSSVERKKSDRAARPMALAAIRAR